MHTSSHLALDSITAQYSMSSYNITARTELCKELLHSKADDESRIACCPCLQLSFDFQVHLLQLQRATPQKKMLKSFTLHQASRRPAASWPPECSQQPPQMSGLTHLLS